MNASGASCVLFLLAAAVPAQGAQVAITALSPIQVAVDANGQVATAASQPGALAATGNVGAWLPNGAGSVIAYWFDNLASTPGQGDTRCDLTYGAVVDLWNTVGPAGGSYGVFELGVAIALPLPQLVQVRIDHDESLPAGVPMPQLLVDLYDDGIVEVTEASPGSLLVYATVGTTPLNIRVRLAGGMNLPNGGSGRLQSYVRIRVTPTWSTMIAPLASGCSGDELAVSRLFASPDVIRIDAPPSSFASLTVLVMGLDLGPAVLPGVSLNGLPCLLLPRPDLLVLLPYLGQFQFTIPPAARPIDIHVQGVEPVVGAGLLTTQAALVRAL